MKRIFVPLALLVLVSACAARSAHIADIQRDPTRYYDKSVAVSGVVTSSWGLPLVPFRVYKIDDGTGEVTVLSQGNRTPTTGSRVNVRGRVSQVAVVGGHSLGLHLNEEHLDVRGK